MREEEYRMDFLPEMASVEVKRREPPPLILDDQSLKAFLHDQKSFQLHLQRKSLPSGLSSEEEKAILVRKYLHDYRQARAERKSLPKVPSLPEGVQKSDLTFFLTHNRPWGIKATPLQATYVVPDVDGINSHGRFSFKVLIDDYERDKNQMLMVIEPKIDRPQGIIGFRLGLAAQTRPGEKLHLCAWSLATRERFELDSFKPDLIPRIAAHLSRAIVLGHGIDLTKPSQDNATECRRQQVLASAEYVLGSKREAEKIQEIAQTDFSLAGAMLLQLEGYAGYSQWHRRKVTPERQKSGQKPLKPVKFEID